ncbi:hypothetical protein [Nocardioides sp.]|uniref:hypothetical protein n=1 Tax=Nocardioides sp. TaxID=35761 RepID=UPI0035136BF3
MTMQAGFEALTQEAAEWDDTSDTLRAAALIAAGLRLETSQFSFVAFMTGVDTDYEAARQHVVDVTTAGMVETRKIADALREVRQDFASTDAGVVDRVRALWVPE